MKLIKILPVLMLMIPSPSHAWQHDLEARSEIFNDNEATNSYTFDQVYHWKDKTTKLGLGATQTLITESGKSRLLEGGLLEGYQKLEHADFTGKLKLLSWNGRLETPLSLASSQTLGTLRLEENVDHGTIDSVKAYDARIDYWSAGGALDWNPLQKLTITGGYWHRWSSDNNDRDLYVGRATYSFTDNFLVQYSYRGIRNDRRVPQYFSPQLFDQHALLLGYADSYFDRLRVKLWVGPMTQDDGFTTSIGAREDLRITWRIDEHWSLAARAEANQVASGYRYLYSTLGISYDF